MSGVDRIGKGDIKVDLPSIEPEKIGEQPPGKGLPTSKKVLDQIKNSKGINVLKTLGKGTLGVLGWTGLVLVSPAALVIWFVIGGTPLKIKASDDGKRHIYATQIQTAFAASYRHAYSKIFNWVKGESAKPEQKKDIEEDGAKRQGEVRVERVQQPGRKQKAEKKEKVEKEEGVEEEEVEQEEGVEKKEKDEVPKNVDKPAPLRRPPRAKGKEVEDRPAEETIQRLRSDRQKTTERLEERKARLQEAARITNEIRERNGLPPL